MRDHWRDLASAAGADVAEAAAFADCFTALVEGALILRQTHGRNDAARVVRPAAEQLILTYLPNASERARPARVPGRRGINGSRGRRLPAAAGR
jgi:hypothetical protein